MSQNNPRLTAWAMLYGNFLIGTCIILPSGLMNDIAKEFAISPAIAGYLVIIGAVVIAIGAPLFATWTSKIDRRLLLTSTMLLLAIGHGLSALAPSFEQQLIIRSITVIGAALFTPQAAATMSLILPQEKRASAIAFIFIGWSVASALGVPLSNYLSSLTDWRVVYACMAGLSLIGAATTYLSVPRGLYVQPLTLKSWYVAFSSPVLLLVYAVTAFSMAGQFTLFTYIAPIMRDGFDANVAMISLAFGIVGVAGILGNMIAARFVQKLGTDKVIALGLMSLATGFIGYGLFFGHYALAMIAGLFWGLGSFSSNSLQQSRLGALQPSIASVTIALNTSCVYLGQSTGAFVGGRILAEGYMHLMPWVAMALMLIALALSFTASKMQKA